MKNRGYTIEIFPYYGTRKSLVVATKNTQVNRYKDAALRTDLIENEVNIWVDGIHYATTIDNIKIQDQTFETYEAFLAELKQWDV